MKEKILKQVQKLSYVYDDDGIEESSICIRVDDNNLTRDLYENGIYITSGFFDKVKKDVQEIIKSNGCADRYDASIILQDKNWVEVRLTER
jgi:hypothetical protein